MPIERACIDCVGKTVFVEPQHGYGWQRYDAVSPAPGKNIDAPPPFSARITEFISEGNELVGGFGVIVEPDSQLDGYSLAFFARVDDDVVNFTDELATYNICISPFKPTVVAKPGLRLLHPDVTRGQGTPCFRGYCAITLSKTSS